MLKTERISHPWQKLLLSAGYLILLALKLILHIPCVWSSLLGVECPGCGMTRAWEHALHLQFGKAFLSHPMFWSVPIVYLYILLDGRLFRRRWVDNAVLIAIGAGFLVSHAIRLLGFLG